LFSHLLGRRDEQRIKDALDATEDKEAEKKYCYPFKTLPDPKTLKSPNPTPQIYCVVPAPTRYNDTAYWVMQMGTEFVPDHSQIFRPAFRELLGKFIVQQINPDKPGIKPATITLHQ
jgi:hypothetical protein